MEDFVLASTFQLSPSSPYQDALCNTHWSSGSIIIIEKEQKWAPLLAKQLALAGLDSCEISQWSGELHASVPPMVVCVVQDRHVSLSVAWELCQVIREYTDVPISIVLSGLKPSDHLANVSFSGGPLLFDSQDKSGAMVHGSTSIQPQHKHGVQAPAFRRQRACFLDSDRHHVTLMGRTFSLTPSEYKILELLMTCPGRVFSRDELISVLYSEPDAVVPRVVDVHISNLRKKIEPDLSNPMFLQSVRGLGYQFAVVSIRART